MGNLNLRVWGTIEDGEGMTHVVDNTWENLDGLFAATFSWEGTKCEQNTATIGAILPMNWAKTMQFMGEEAGKETFILAVAHAMEMLGIGEN